MVSSVAAAVLIEAFAPRGGSESKTARGSRPDSKRQRGQSPFSGCFSLGGDGWRLVWPGSLRRSVGASGA